MIKYYPVFLSKAGEFKALENLSIDVKNEVAPIIQVTHDGFEKTEMFLSSFWVFNGNTVFLDFSTSEIVNGNLKKDLIENLLAAGVNIVPVIHSNSDTLYLRNIQSLIDRGVLTNICLRFVVDDYIVVDDIIIPQDMNIDISHISLLFDLGFVRDVNFNDSESYIIETLQNLRNAEAYENIIIASSSFLKDLSSLVPAGRIYRLRRYEWDIWQSVLENINYNNIKYADYGTKHPIYSEANFQGSCSIKYTVEKEYVIFRGEKSDNHALGNGQYINFANDLINSHDYSGIEFSWGDKSIDFHARQDVNHSNRKPGNAGTWVGISQNHHITLLHSLL